MSLPAFPSQPLPPTPPAAHLRWLQDGAEECVGDGFVTHRGGHQRLAASLRRLDRRLDVRIAVDLWSSGHHQAGRKLGKWPFLDGAVVGKTFFAIFCWFCWFNIWWYIYIYIYMMMMVIIVFYFISWFSPLLRNAWTLLSSKRSRHRWYKDAVHLDVNIFKSNYVHTAFDCHLFSNHGRCILSSCHHHAIMQEYEDGKADVRSLVARKTFWGTLVMVAHGR